MFPRLRTVAAAVALLAVFASLGWWVAIRDGDVLSSETSFGSTVSPLPGESGREALARLDASYGPLELVRVYADGLPPSWSSLRRRLGDASVVISFKIDPAQVLSGDSDARLRSWFAEAPTDRDTYWVYFHEPEDDVERGEFAPEEFRRAWEHIAELAADSGNSSLHATMILMCHTVNPSSGRDWRDYVPRTDLLDVLAWDCYNHGADKGRYEDPRLLLSRAVKASRAVSADWGIGELGSHLALGDDGTGRAAWLRAVGVFALGEGARFVIYFDADVGGDFRLTDEPSKAAWQSLVIS